MWSIFFDLYIDQRTFETIQLQAKKLLEYSSFHKWNSSCYGTFLRIVNTETLQILQRYWRQYSSTNIAYMEGFKAGVRKTYNRHYKDIQSVDPRMEAVKRFWANGTITSGASASKLSYCNQLFAYSGISGSRFSIDKNTSPLAGFHVCSALYPVSRELSSSQDTQDRNSVLDSIVTAARNQWKSWCDAFRHRVVEEIRSNGRGLRIRFYIGDAVAFCLGLHLRLYNLLGQLTELPEASRPIETVNCYSRPGTTQPLRLDGEDYHLKSRDPAPSAFNIIDTGYLVDSVGTLTILPAVLLLLNSNITVIYTNTRVRNIAKESDLLVNMLCGDVNFMCTLLGMVPVPYLCGTTTRSYHQYNRPDDMLPVTHRITWRDPTIGDTKINCDSVLPKSGPEEFAMFLYKLYLKMFPHESINNGANANQYNSVSLPVYSKSSFAALVVFMKRRIACSWDACMSILNKILADNVKTGLGAQGMGDLLMHLRLCGAFSEPLPDITSLPTYSLGVLKHPSAPIDAAIVLRVPRSHLLTIYNKIVAQEERLPLSFQLYLQKRNGMTPQTFSSVHAIFGRLQSSTDGESGTFEEDPNGWQGTSDLYLCCYVPTFILRLWGNFPNIVVGTKLWPEKEVLNLLKDNLGDQLILYNVRLSNKDKVYFFRSLPGLRAPSPKSLPALDKEVAFKNDIYSVKFPRLGFESGVFTTEINVIGEGHKVLRSGESIAITQDSQCTLTITYGKIQLHCSFPFPVLHCTRTTVRVSRMMGWLEVIAPLVTSSDRGLFADYPFHVVREKTGSRLHGLFLSYLNFRRLLKLENSDNMAKQLQPHLMSMFSDREMVMYAERGEKFDRLLHAKDVIRRMFLSSTRVIRIRPTIPGRLTFVFFVAGLYFDYNSQSLVAEAYVMAVTPMSTSVLAGISSDEIPVDEDETNFWSYAIPAMIERCRDWEHTPHCEHTPSRKEIVPICSCGKGKIGKEFLNVDTWKQFAPEVTRIAVSPLFAVPYIEPTRGSTPKPLSIRYSFGANTNARLGDISTCKMCQKEAAKKCARCKNAEYCSRECQVKDWQEHKKYCGTGTG